MNSYATYHLLLVTIFLALAIYNINTSVTANRLQCYVKEQMDYYNYTLFYQSLVNNTDIYKVINNSLNRNFVVNPASNEDILYFIPILKSNPFVSLQKGIGVIYVIMTIINLTLCISINYMANLIPEDFFRIGKLKIFVGSLVKLLPFFNIISHWIILIFICIIWGFVFVKECNESISIEPGVISKPDRYFNDTWILNTVTCCFWIVIHYCGSLLKEIFHEEPFMYTKRNNHGKCLECFFCGKLGP